MVYLVLTQAEQDEILTNTLYAQERDHFCYTQNVDRYTALLKSLAVDDPHRDRIAALLVTETAALAQTEAHLTETLEQVKAVDVVAAKARIDAKAAAARGGV